MTRATITRRALVQGSAATLGGAALPGIVVQPMALLVPSAAEAAPDFDAAGFVADLRSAGFRVWFVWPIDLDGEPRGWPSYSIEATDGHGLGQARSDVLDRWRPAMVADPDYRDRVADFLEAETAAAGGRA